MSAGGVFTLICNDGKADNLILASGMLKQRIKDVVCKRRANGEQDVTPTLADIEKTHVLFMNAHFKPFAAVGFEYNKVRSQAGSPSLGNSATFSIPQFGDFFHDIVARTRLSRCYGVAGSTPAHNGASFPLDTSTVSYNIVDASGVVLVAGDTTAHDTTETYRNFVRYCEYPGDRLFSKVKFEVQGNPLDEYTEMVPVMLRKFCTMPGKKVGCDRLAGQEVALDGYSGLRFAAVTDADSANTPTGITKDSSTQSNQSVCLFNSNTINSNSTLVGQSSISTLNSDTADQFDVSRERKSIVNGAQTPKPVQPPLELWNKLRFWFNEDVHVAVPSVSLPSGNRYISIDFAAQTELTFEEPSIFLEKIDVSTADSHVRTYSPIFQKFGVSDVTIEKMELYINNIFVNSEIHDIYIERIGFSLIRVYRYHSQRCNQESSEDRLLSSLKWPIEYIFMGLRPVWNIKDITSGTGGLVNGGNENKWRDWHRLTRMVDATYEDRTAQAYVLGTGEDHASSGSLQTDRIMPDKYYLPVPTVNSLSLTSHGVKIYDNFGDTFYNQYAPMHFGGANLCTPEDPGAMFINMALFPRMYQPSGHLNISRARETYLGWTTNYVSSVTPVDLFAIAVAINFLLITDGSAILRYTT